MTHYCMLGNQPRMDLQAAEDGKMMFMFSEDNEVDPAKGMHMHSLAMSLVDKDNIVQRWTMFQGGRSPAVSRHASDPGRVNALFSRGEVHPRSHPYDLAANNRGGVFFCRHLPFL